VLELADAGGAALHRSLTEIVGSAPQLDANRLHELAARLARRDAEAAYRAAADLLLLLLAGMAKAAAGGDGSGENAVRRVASRADGARWAALRAEIADSFAQTDALNLDKRQALLGAFFAIAELSR
jgi:DNA polymerase-3 subunit delta'